MTEETVPRSQRKQTVAAMHSARRANKKGGAGSHNWGRAGDEYGEPAAMDKNDPNWDPEEEADMTYVTASAWSEA